MKNKIDKENLTTDTNFADLFEKIGNVLIKDRFVLKKQLKRIFKDRRTLSQEIFQKQLISWLQRYNKSIAETELRRKNLPEISYCQGLPVTDAIDKIRQAFTKNPVIIVASETGSGKTTQLPKMCLQSGQGIFGKIAHTQPRRIAAISVANRIASELNSSVGEFVGYKVRFQDKTSKKSYLKLLTDGMLLAEIQQDHFLNEYDTIIIDEPLCIPKSNYLTM